MSQSEEIWKEIPGFPSYEVSNFGKVRSKKRVKLLKNGRKVHFKSRLKSLRKHPINKFYMTDLIDEKGKRKTVYPHKAVASAFLENDDPKKNRVVMHIDGNNTNNHIDNLKWASYKESIQEAFRTGKRDNSKLWEVRRARYGKSGGTKPMGRRDPLNDKQKEEIYKLRTEEHITLEALAKKFDCSASHVLKTVRLLDEKKSKSN